MTLECKATMRLRVFVPLLFGFALFDSATIGTLSSIASRYSKCEEASVDACNTCFGFHTPDAACHSRISTRKRVTIAKCMASRTFWPRDCE